MAKYPRKKVPLPGQISMLWTSPEKQMTLTKEKLQKLFPRGIRVLEGVRPGMVPVLQKVELKRVNKGHILRFMYEVIEKKKTAKTHVNPLLSKYDAPAKEREKALTEDPVVRLLVPPEFADKIRKKYGGESEKKDEKGEEIKWVYGKGGKVRLVGNLGYDKVNQLGKEWAPYLGYSIIECRLPPHVGKRSTDNYYQDLFKLVENPEVVAVNSTLEYPSLVSPEKAYELFVAGKALMDPAVAKRVEERLKALEEIKAKEKQMEDWEQKQAEIQKGIEEKTKKGLEEFKEKKEAEREKSPENGKEMRRKLMLTPKSRVEMSNEEAKPAAKERAGTPGISEHEKVGKETEEHERMRRMFEESSDVPEAKEKKKFDAGGFGERMPSSEDAYKISLKKKEAEMKQEKRIAEGKGRAPGASTAAKTDGEKQTKGEAKTAAEEEKGKKKKGGGGGSFTVAGGMDTGSLLKLIIMLLLLAAIFSLILKAIGH